PSKRWSRSAGWKSSTACASRAASSGQKPAPAPSCRRRSSSPTASRRSRSRSTTPRSAGNDLTLIVSAFPRDVREIEHTLIPLSDGTRLAARLWLPADAERNPVPAILEYLPYRKRDGTHERDALTHPYLAGHGYASVRVDIRGSGESEGVLSDEYSQPEDRKSVV